MADLTKAGTQVDEWAEVSAGDIREGAVVDIPSDMQIVFEVTICKIEAVAHDGHVEIIPEMSSNTSGDEDWSEGAGVEITAETASTTTLDVEAAAAATTVPLAATANFTTKGDRYLIKNGTIANSEIVRNNGYADGVSITILDGLTNTQQNGVSIYTSVKQFLITVAAPFRRARMLVNNLDADCDIITRTRIAKVTAIA